MCYVSGIYRAREYIDRSSRRRTWPIEDARTDRDRVPHYILKSLINRVTKMVYKFRKIPDQVPNFLGLPYQKGKIYYCSNYYSYWHDIWNTGFDGGVKIKLTF